MRSSIRALTTVALLSGALAIPAASFAAPPPAKPAPAKNAKVETTPVEGEVVAVDAVHHTLKLKTEQGEVSYSVAPSTKLTAAGKPSNLKAIKTGQHLKGTFKAKGTDRVIQTGEIS